MTRKGPLVTLLCGAALAGVLLVASINAAGGGDEPDPALAGGASPTPPPEPEPAQTGTPAPAQEEEPVTYVGYVDGGTASVAIIITGGEATAYVCDGAAAEAWLTGTAREGELRLDGDAGSLTASYDVDQASGETTAQGRDWTFTVESVDPPEGLYRFADTVVGGAEVDGGWIVLPDGTQIGLLTVDGETAPAPALDPATGQVEVAGQAVTADRLG